MEAGAVPREPVRPAPATAVANAIADPGPLGLAAFALTTFVLSMFNANLVGKAGEPVVLGLALAYGGLVQLLAGMWAFKRGDTFAAVAFSSYGAFWLSFWALVALYSKDLTTPEAASKGIGLYLVAWGIFTAYMWVASFRRSVGVMLVFLALTITFFLLGIGNADNNTDIIHAGGYAGLLTAFFAWYTSFAEVMFASFGRWVLPVKPLNTPR
jgi:succinate-acetate transporter protein